MFSLQHENKIDLWKMSKILPSTSINGSDGERIPCEAPVHLTSISTESIRSTRLSPDGNYLAFSTLNKLRVYRIDTQEYNIQINKVFFMGVRQKYNSFFSWLSRCNQITYLLWLSNFLRIQKNCILVIR